MERSLQLRSWVHSEMVYERYEQMDPEQLSSGQEIEIPESRVVPRAARKIYGECSVKKQPTTNLVAVGFGLQAFLGLAYQFIQTS
jgi:hypothetical protein